MLILMLPQISAHPCIDDDTEPTISLSPTCFMPWSRAIGSFGKLALASDCLNAAYYIK
jgi:hypothetical protein